MDGLSGALARAVRRRRESLGISQEELAHRANLHRTYISLIERGVRKPTVEVVDRIARALAIKTSALVASAERDVSRRG